MLLVAPWSAFWDRNFFAAHVPSLAVLLTSPFLRGAVSGIGGITLIAGIGELATLFVRPKRPTPERNPAPSQEH